MSRIGLLENFKHIKNLHTQSKLDGLFFLDPHAISGIHTELLTELQRNVPTDMFRSFPVFMPIEYSNADFLRLGLDSHFVFYQYRDDGTYKLVDKFAVNVLDTFRSPPIVLELGTWKKGNGLQLVKSLDRSSRRTDLKGLPFIVDNRMAPGIGNMIKIMLWQGMTLAMNLTYKKMTVRNQRYRCGMATIARTAETSNCGETTYGANPAFYIQPMKKDTYTFLAAVRTENVVKTTVHIDVFGLGQWMVIFAALIVISLLTHMFQVVLVGYSKRHTVPWSEGLALPFLFLIQQGSHPEDRHLAKSTLSLTLSLVTMMVFIYYANDITSEMTAGSPPPSIESFQDAIDKGYKIHVYHGMSVAMGMLRGAKYGSAKHLWYIDNVLDDSEKIRLYEGWRQLGIMAKAKEVGAPKWHTDMTHHGLHELLRKDKKALWWGSPILNPVVFRQGKLTAIDMPDSQVIWTGCTLQKDSEYIPMMQNRWLHGMETGVFDYIKTRFETTLYNAMPAVKIGMNEASVLTMENVVPLFYFLILFGIISTAISVVEKLVPKYKSLKSRRSEVTLHSNTFSTKIA